MRSLTIQIDPDGPQMLKMLGGSWKRLKRGTGIQTTAYTLLEAPEAPWELQSTAHTLLEAPDEDPRRRKTAYTRLGCG